MRPLLCIAISTLAFVAQPSALWADRADEATRILTELAAAKGDRDERLAKIDELVGIAPPPTKAITDFLARKRSSGTDTRRSLLKSIGAAVPNAKGSFRDPGKQKKESLAEGDKFDWAAKLAEKKASPAVGDALADIAAIRALARSDDPAGALHALQFGFSATGLIYRDEVGRYLRRGSPLSVPGLIYGLHDDRKDIRNYSRYQLERVDREAPHKAMRAARGNEALGTSILKAYADTLHREAVYVIVDYLDDESHALRVAARETWQKFVTTKPKNPPPRRRLSLPGGGYTKTTTKLYYGHQELAAVALRKRLEKMTGTAPAEGISLEDLSKQYLSLIDTARADSSSKAFDAGRKAMAAGELGQAVARFDEVLATDPGFAKRAEMAEAYLGYGKKLLEEKDYESASVVLRKASAIDPDGDFGKEALAKGLVARARVIDAAGGDSAADLAKADAAAPESDSSGGPKWMMFVGIGAGLAGLFLLIAGILMRRR